jgi:UDP-N-acetylmuramate dehydrogenase
LADRDVHPAAGVPLAPLTTLGVGGRAQAFLTVDHPDQLLPADRWCEARGLPMVVLGGGSNLVVADEGVTGLVVAMRVSGLRFERRSGDTLAHAGAGEPWDGIVAGAVARGLAGVECLSGIPGSAGGTPIQNVGAYGQEIADVLDAVTVFDRHTRALSTLTAAECRLSYRMSRFKREDAGRFVVCGISLRLAAGGPVIAYPDLGRYLAEARVSRPSLLDVREAVLAIRRRKGMVVDPGDPDSRSVGSFFMNPVLSAEAHERLGSIAGAPAPGFPLPDGRVKVPAAWLIERAGFCRGDADGRVGISTRHPLALVNRGGASARDVLRLAARIKRRVGERFGIALRPEPVFVGFEADTDVRYLTEDDGSVHDAERKE